MARSLGKKKFVIPIISLEKKKLNKHSAFYFFIFLNIQILIQLKIRRTRQLYNVRLINIYSNR